MFVPINLIILLLLIVGLIWFQVILAKKNSKEPGLILPIVSFVFSLIVTFNVLAADLSGFKYFGFIVSTFLLINIPTVIFVIIYLLSKKAIKKKEKIPDLY